MGQQYIGERFGDYKVVRPLGDSQNFIFLGIVAIIVGAIIRVVILIVSESMLGAIIALIIIALGLVFLIIGIIGLAKVERIKSKARNTT